MLDVNKHKFLIVQILKDIYSDLQLAECLGFKGGTALMLFYDLPRFSVDLDFNLLKTEHSSQVYEKINKILLKYGKIKDKAEKHFGLIVVLDYGEKERNLKVEISNRKFEDRYEIKNFLGINVRVMKKEDMFAHKLVSLLDRNMIANRDIFDCYYFMQKRTPFNKKIVEIRSGMSLDLYLDKCINAVKKLSNNKILDGLGELMDDELKKFVKDHLLKEIILLFEMYKKFPIIDQEAVL